MKRLKIFDCRSGRGVAGLRIRATEGAPCRGRPRINPSGLAVTSHRTPWIQVTVSKLGVGTAYILLAAVP